MEDIITGCYIREMKEISINFDGIVGLLQNDEYIK